MAPAPFGLWRSDLRSGRLAALLSPAPLALGRLPLSAPGFVALPGRPLLRCCAVVATCLPPYFRATRGPPACPTRLPPPAVLGRRFRRSGGAVPERFFPDARRGLQSTRPSISVTSAAGRAGENRKP